jgi:hypothetical protein
VLENRQQTLYGMIETARLSRQKLDLLQGIVVLRCVVYGLCDAAGRNDDRMIPVDVKRAATQLTPMCLILSIGSN